MESYKNTSNLFYQILERVKRVYSIDEARAIVFALFKYCFSLEAYEIFLNRTPLTSQKIEQVNALSQRIEKEEPIQYVLGHTMFMDYKFKVNPSVLIPRIETEELVSLLLEQICPSARVLDIGTGSGCIAIVLSLEKPDCYVEAWDICEKAMNVAIENAQHLKTHIHFFQKDIFSPHLHTKNQFDYIISNPPYIPYRERGNMKKNVTMYEPEKALFVPDEKPVIFYEKMISIAQNLLSPKGKLFFEIHENYTDLIINLAIDNNYAIEVKKDMMQKDRFVILNKKK